MRREGSTNTIEEEEEARLLQAEVDEVHERSRIPRRFYVLGFILTFLVLFFFFALILWGASHNKHPIVTVNVCSNSFFSIKRTLTRYQDKK
jgi:cell division septal protein FtsQ